MKYSLLFLALILLQSKANAQRAQIGFSTSIGINSFIKNGDSKFDENIYVPRITPSFGIGLPVMVHLNSLLSVESGFNFQRKKVSFRAQNFEFPQLVSNGYFQVDVAYNTFQIPLVLMINQSARHAYSLGVLWSVSQPTFYQTTANWTPTYNGTDTLIYKFEANAENFETVFLPNFYLGYTYSFLDNEGTRKHQLKLSAEIGIQSLGPVQSSMVIENSTTGIGYNAAIQPQLLTAKISYVFFPSWGSFGVGPVRN